MRTCLCRLKNKINQKKVVVVISAFAILFQLLFYVYGIATNYKLANEFKYIDEETILKDINVSNHKYINNNLLFNPALTSYVYNSFDNILLDDKKGSGFTFFNNPKYFVFDSYNKKRYSYLLGMYKGHIANVQYSRDLNLTLAEADYRDNSFLENLLNDNGQKMFLEYPLFYADSLDELKNKVDFISYNIFEQNMQVLSRYYWHEASFMLLPISDIKSYRNNSEIFSQYGYFSLYTIDYISEMLGGFNINNFEKSKNIVNLVYFLITVYFIVSLFDDITLRGCLILLACIRLLFIPYYAYHYAPGVIDTRHFFDLIIVLLLYYASRAPKPSKYLLFLASLLAVLSILMSNDFGLFIFVSLLGTFIIRYVLLTIYEKRLSIIRLVLVAIYAISGFVSYIEYPLMKNPSIKYFLDGFYSFNIPMTLFFFILAIVAIQWLMLILFFNKLKEYKYLDSYIFLLFYTEFLYTYFIWKLDNLSMNVFIFSLPFFIVLAAIKIKYKQVLHSIIFICLIFYYIKLPFSYFSDIYNFNLIFNNHKTYVWNHERAGGIVSTYSFELFEDSLKLIDKYSSSDSKIYMISKYDNVLQFFSKKYSGLKYFELKSFLVSDIEYKEVIELLNKDADILYVDSDIDRDYELEIGKRNFFDIYGSYWYNENIKQRIPKLKTLSRLFNDVKNNYVLIEKGKLINVYKKI
ncbi:hypothetical protein [Campylobacter concisus]|uniref:Glycosyltransferase RgtA/B/C/D-like domain-containing protein n=2 Tax=Campylobacter concisus TaxID=199 RepID=A0A1Y5N8T0_9BACT|nr:hypothetical protein [Campylobacter concisus]OUT17187.1 hypothetical protein B9N61_07710 [Campylobacter concisus]